MQLYDSQYVFKLSSLIIIFWQPEVFLCGISDSQHRKRHFILNDKKHHKCKKLCTNGTWES